MEEKTNGRACSFRRKKGRRWRTRGSGIHQTKVERKKRRGIKDLVYQVKNIRSFHEINLEVYTAEKRVTRGGAVVEGVQKKKHTKNPPPNKKTNNPNKKKGKPPPNKKQTRPQSTSKNPNKKKEAIDLPV